MKKIFNFLIVFVLLLSSCTLTVPALFGVSIAKVEWQDLENLAVYLRNADADYLVKVGDVRFECSFDESDPDLLVCVGGGVEPGDELVIEFYDEETGGEPLAELTFNVPEQPEEMQDKDGDGVPNTEDKCPTDKAKTEPGECGCGKPDLDSDGDGTPDCKDDYPKDPTKSKPEENEGEDDDVNDTDEDGVPDEEDKCPEDPDKTEPGKCGCGTPDVDEDEDGIIDCEDKCPGSAYQDKIGDPCDPDEDNDGYKDGADQCPYDPFKFKAGYCGCGEKETDTDKDGYPDCVDLCPNNPKLKVPGECGCEVCEELCPDGSEFDPVEDPCCHDEDGDGYSDWIDDCPFDPMKKHPGYCGCGEPETDTDGDGWPDCYEDCDYNPEKKHEGLCGCGCPETPGCTDPDTDGDFICDCWDACPTEEGIPIYAGCPGPI